MKDIINKYFGVKNKTVYIYCPIFSPNIGQPIFGELLSIIGYL
jgi:hypothetical protein